MMGFELALLICSLAGAAASVVLLVQNPGVSGPGFLPLVCACVCTLTSAVNLCKKAKPRPHISARFWITVLLTALFCAGLYFGAPFYVCAAAFEFILMTVLRRGKYLSNALVTLGSIGAFYLIFELFLGIALP